MKIAAVQISSLAGQISENIQYHLDCIDQATRARAEMIVFPELSITGYEPKLADKLAFTLPDRRLDIFQKTADQHSITIGMGLPIRSDVGVHIGMALFRPFETTKVYHKEYLHPDEFPFFKAGNNHFVLINESPAIAPAICYEISVDAHIQKAVFAGAEIYLASVAKFANGISTAQQRLSTIAQTYAKTVIMANSVGMADGAVCGGRSAVWNSKGEIMGELGDTEEGYLILDTETGVVFRS
jgi:predicted amidohydrolase